LSHGCDERLFPTRRSSDLMATERLSMRQTREILRQKWRLGRTHREVAQSLRISTGAVGTTVLRARAAGLDWAQVDALSDDVLHRSEEHTSELQSPDNIVCR